MLEERALRVLLAAWVRPFAPMKSCRQCFTGERGGPPSKVQAGHDWNTSESM